MLTDRPGILCFQVPCNCYVFIVPLAWDSCFSKEDFDYDAFFRAYANLWLTRDSLQKVYQRINDNHPMPYLRTNATLQQFDEFLDFYGITEGDGMYLAPESRVSIW